MGKIRVYWTLTRMSKRGKQAETEHWPPEKEVERNQQGFGDNRSTFHFLSGGRKENECVNPMLVKAGADGSCFPLRKETSSCETEWCTGEEGEGTLGREKKTENRASLLAQWVKSLPAMQETWVQFLGQEDTLGKGMTTHSSILAWRIPWTEEPGSLQSMGSQESDTGKWLSKQHREFRQIHRISLL